MQHTLAGYSISGAVYGVRQRGESGAVGYRARSELTLSFLRPFARLRERTLLPFLEAIRFRNP